MVLGLYSTPPCKSILSAYRKLESESDRYQIAVLFLCRTAVQYCLIFFVLVKELKVESSGKIFIETSKFLNWKAIRSSLILDLRYK